MQKRNGALQDPVNHGGGERFVVGEERWASIGEFRMRYLFQCAQNLATAGPPIVLIHGLLGYSFSWRFNIEALSERASVYAVDLLGIGFSERPPRGALSFSLGETARRLLRWMREEGLHGVDLVGTSHGGGLVMMMAAIDAEERGGIIGRLVLVAPMNPWSRVGLRRTRLLGHPVGAFCFRTIVPAIGIFSVARGLMLERMYADPAKVTRATRQGYDAPIRTPGTVDYVLDIVKHWHGDLAKLKEKAAIILAPTLLVWGDQDSAVPVTSAAKLKLHMRDAELVVMPGVGHLPYEEAPEEFNRILIDWLSRTAPSRNLGDIAGPGYASP
ncbi:MAG TPA: alpha/beta fold hydrolase [Clostridia bacterium]|nr:alpha/beta fold hydrolase [Clostridia bacterium]